MKRALLVVLDSVGCGHAPDAADYGDAGADTLGHLFDHVPGFELPNLASLGLYRILGLQMPAQIHDGARWARLTCTSAGKDTTTGHWELMGHPLSQPFATFSQFPKDLVAELEQRANVSFIGNTAASGTEILKQLGEQHLQSGRPILYTSADSVMQIAAHEEVFGLLRLWKLCKTARTLLNERKIRIGRVIARPFVGTGPDDFTRTANRHDYSLTPSETALNRLQNHGITTIGIGKIADIFADSGISESIPTKYNAGGMNAINRIWNAPYRSPHFIFANLVDFDSLYGHRRDPVGYAACLREFDAWLGSFLPKLLPDDLLIITADHGNDPYHHGTDHTREQVPVMTLGWRHRLADGVFSDVARMVENHFAAA